MKRVLYIGGTPVLTIDTEASPVNVGTDEAEDFVPIAEYLETTLTSEMHFDAIHMVVDVEWKTE